MQKKQKLVYIIAGEPSGDLLGAELIKTFRNEGLAVTGIGGEHMRAEGLVSLFPMEELSLIGVWGILKNLPQLLKRITETVRDIQEKKPEVVITIDSPEFCFRVQKKVKRVLKAKKPFQAHLVAPTVWAWRPGRAKKIAKYLDQLFCIYPFEPKLFERYGLSSIFVGHPIVNEPHGNGAKFRRKHGISETDNVICLLPGSRKAEIKTLLPIFQKAIDELLTKDSDLKIVLPTVNKHYETLKNELSHWNHQPVLVQGIENRRDAFAASNVALAASGTVALQLAHAEVPMVVAYKIGPFPRMWMKLILQTPWVCMINILRGRKVVPELLQTDCTPHQCAEAIAPLLYGKKTQSRDLAEAIQLLAVSPHRRTQLILNALPVKK